jgi:hypothetical protein
LQSALHTRFCRLCISPAELISAEDGLRFSSNTWQHCDYHMLPLISPAELLEGEEGCALSQGTWQRDGQRQIRDF